VLTLRAAPQSTVVLSEIDWLIWSNGITDVLKDVTDDGTANILVTKIGGIQMSAHKVEGHLVLLHKSQCFVDPATSTGSRPTN